MSGVYAGFCEAWLDFVQSKSFFSRDASFSLDFVQSGVAFSSFSPKFQAPRWIKSTLDNGFPVFRSLDWTKSTIHAINLTRNPVPSWFVIIISFDLIFYMSFGWGEEKRATGEESQKKLPKKGLDPNGFVTGLESSQPHVHFCLCQVESEGRSWLVFAFAFPDWFVP